MKNSIAEEEGHRKSMVEQSAVAQAADVEGQRLPNLRVEEPGSERAIQGEGNNKSLRKS